jgi:dTDP-4-dehydrorhamnose 3,5-epimerase
MDYKIVFGEIVMKTVGNFTFNDTDIKDVYIIEPKVFGDSRGYFEETYQYENFKEAGLDMIFIQDNESKSKKGVLRGLHFQTQYSQGKLVRVLNGKVFDVVVDLRKDSETYGKWTGVVLSSENKKMLYIPENFAHGFLVLSDEATFAYKCTNLYHPEFDSGILWNDKVIDIVWPTDGLDEIILSDKDKKQQTFAEFDCKNR